MKNTAIRLRSLCAALAALVLLLALAAPAFAADGFADLYYRMNDSAEVLTEDEDSELEASLEELSVRQSFAPSALAAEPAVLPVEPAVEVLLPPQAAKAEAAANTPVAFRKLRRLILRIGMSSFFMWNLFLICKSFR